MKKILTALLAVIMIASTVSIAAFAAAPTPITLKAPEISASAGATVDILITAEDIGSDGLRSALFEVKTEGGLEITSRKLNPGGQKQLFDVVKGSHVRFYWVAEKTNQYIKSGDVVATITVTVPATAEKGDSFAITIIPSSDPGDFFGGENFTGEDGEPAYGAVAQNGKIVIGDSMRGDVNGDGKVNAKDIIAVMRHMLGNTPQDFNEPAADMDGNGKVNAKDIIAIMREMLNAK